jgi:hypothetical protein
MVVLDLTAANRIMWKDKEPHDFIFVDIERNLDVKPTILSDNRCSAFRSKSIDIIYIDLPHDWRKSESLSFYTSPNREIFNKRFPKYASNRSTRYYGWDKVKSKEELLKLVESVSKESLRILNDDGIFNFKWCEVKIPISQILEILEIDWVVLMNLPIKSKMQTSNCQTYWVIMQKRI